MDLLIAVIGWGFTLFLAFSAFKKGEISRLKDTVISEVDSIYYWVCVEVEQHRIINASASNRNRRYLRVNAHRCLELHEIEGFFSEKVNHLEYKINHLNLHAGRKIVDENVVLHFRRIDIVKILDGKKSKDLLSAMLKIKEEIHESYGNVYMNNFGLPKVKDGYVHEFTGWFLGLITMILAVIMIMLSKIFSFKL